jgi:hypothetical protein
MNNFQLKNNFIKALSKSKYSNFSLDNISITVMPLWGDARSDRQLDHIRIGQNLIDQNLSNEVMAHELGHIIYEDVNREDAWLALSLVVIFLGVFNYYLLGLILLIPLIQRALNHRQEYRADRVGYEICGESYLNLLRLLEKERASFTHPSGLNRLKKIQNIKGHNNSN